MSAPFNARFERTRQDEMTPERIMQIARSRGVFSVSLRWRDEWLQRRCAKLRKDGLLLGGRRNGRQIEFYPAKEPTQ